VNVPVFENVNVKLAPGASEFELQTPLSDVDVCAVVSLFVHVTAVPRATAIGLGL
jgi:hypothetical protein